MSLRPFLRGLLATLAVTTMTSAPSFGAIYNEANSADLSGAPTSPTPFSLDLGSNTLTGSAGANDFDLVRFTVPAGNRLTSLILSSYTNPFGGVSFIGLGPGSTWQAGL